MQYGHLLILQYGHLLIREKSVRAAPLQKCGVTFFSVFLCQRCRAIWPEILVKVSVLHFHQNFTPKNGVKNGKFQANFNLLGRSTEKAGNKTESLRECLQEDLPLRGRFTSQRLSALLPLVVLPLNLSPTFYSQWHISDLLSNFERNGNLKAIFRSLRNANKISLQQNLQFQNFIVVTFPKQNSVLDDFPLCPHCPPPFENANFIFLSSRRL